MSNIGTIQERSKHKASAVVRSKLVRAHFAPGMLIASPKKGAKVR